MKYLLEAFLLKKNLNGVTKHLQDLKNMGVETVWLMPIFASPSPHGYDVTDYKDINPDYGTIGDLKKTCRKGPFTWDESYSGFTYKSLQQPKPPVQLSRQKHKKRQLVYVERQ